MPRPRFYFEPISRRHDVSNFKCADTWLEEYLRLNALKESEADQSRTHLLMDAFDADRLVGYFTVKMEAHVLTGLSCATDDSPNPVVEIVALARRADRHHEGLGDLLLFEALRIAADVSDMVGGVGGVYLSSTRAGVPLYEKFGFEEYPDKNRRMYLPMDVCRKYAAHINSSGRAEPAQ